MRVRNQTDACTNPFSASPRPCPPHPSAPVRRSLPHTAHKNGQWAGLYGVNASWGYVPTVITTNSLIGKNGQVLHPEQARVFSVREFARAQGFPDSYRFEGGLADRYKEVSRHCYRVLVVRALSRETTCASVCTASAATVRHIVKQPFVPGFSQATVYLTLPMGLLRITLQIGNAVAPPVGRAIGSALMGAGSM